MTPTVVRAVRLDRRARSVIGAADCPVLAVGDAVTLDPAAIGPALDEVLYQLRIDDREPHLAGVSIGPPRAGVGSGPALPAWLEQRARQLGENMVCAGKLGISFCPQRALDTAIMICEQANITVSRIDFAPVAAARTLQPGTDTVTVGSGRGWRARLRDDEVLEALENPEIAGDDPLRVITADGVGVSIDEFYGVSIDPGVGVGDGSEDDIGHLATAVGAAVGVVDGSSGNLLDGDTVRGRSVPSAFGESAGVFGTGPDAFGSRTTVDLVRSQGEAESRSVIRRAATVDQPGSDSDLFVSADDPVDDATLSLRDTGAEGSAGLGMGEGLGSGADTVLVGAIDPGRQTGLQVHPDDPIQNFSPEPGAEHSLESRGRNMALIIAALVIFSIAVAIGILVTRG